MTNAILGRIQDHEPNMTEADHMVPIFVAVIHLAHVPEQASGLIDWR
jgi:hypothetical protein